VKCYSNRSVRLWIPSVNIKTYRGLVFHSAIIRVLRVLMVVLWDASSIGISGTAAEGRPSCVLLVVTLKNANNMASLELIFPCLWHAPHLLMKFFVSSMWLAKRIHSAKSLHECGMPHNVLHMVISGITQWSWRLLLSVHISWVNRQSRLWRGTVDPICGDDSRR
jgi:hypothetical protein